jgi:hypothetical protein
MQLGKVREGKLSDGEQALIPVSHTSNCLDSFHVSNKNDDFKVNSYK